MFPINEVVHICADALYRSDITPPALKVESFRKLIIKVTTGVQFSFDDRMWQQVDGVAMGSPLGPVLSLSVFVSNAWRSQRISNYYCIDDMWMTPFPTMRTGNTVNSY